MARRRAFFALLVAVALALSTRGALAAGASRAPQPPPLLERVSTVPDGLITSLILSLRDRVAIVYRSLRAPRIADDLFEGTGYHTDTIYDGPDGVDPLGAKGGLHGTRTDQTRRSNF